VELLLNRVISLPDSTIGTLSIDGVPFCFTLEDEKREVKVRGETRIPDGTYEIKFRKVISGLTEKYRSKYDWFTFHLELQGVPGFNYVYIHIGNYEHQSDGCILVGQGAMMEGKGWIMNSTLVFKQLYLKISEALNQGEIVCLTIKS